MTGIYVLVGASVLGVLSCMLIVWSLWTRSQARKRARERMQSTGQHAVVPPVGYPMVQHAPPSGHTMVMAPPAPVDEEPRTEFMSSADLFGQVAVPDEPTQFLSDEDLYGASARAVDEPGTAIMSDQELFGDDDEQEVATTFMTTEEVFGGHAAPPTDATQVLRGQAPAPAPARPAPPRHVPTPKPATPPRYTGFVGDRAEDRDDEDDDFGEDDPETELVHQAELLRLINQNRRSE
jgi:hypothetical protein